MHLDGAAISVLSPGIRIIWGVSANSRTTALLEEG